MIKNLINPFACFSLSLLLAPGAFSAAFTPGDLVVVQVGATGSLTALAGTATATFLDEYTTGGTLVQQIALPTATSGSSDALTLSGSSTSEGFLSFSADGNYLTLGGYDQTVGGTTSGASAATVNRVVGLVSMNGTVDTTTAINGGTSGNIRSVATVSGSSFYVGSSSGSIGYVAYGSASAATQLSTTAPTNIRVVHTSAGQLYMSAASGTFLGVGTLGTGLPTTAGQTPSLLTGFPTSGTHSSYDFWFANSTTLYVADDGSAASGGGIQKWTLSSGTWTLQYNLLNNGTSDTAVRGLSGYIDGSGDTILFGTTSATALIQVTDEGSAAASLASLTTLATAGANTAFRDVEMIPTVPEPSTMALLGVGAVGAFLLRRRK